MRNLILAALLFTLSFLRAQDATFEVSVSNDSILMGNRFAVTYTLQNGQGEDFYVPDFTGFLLVGGPNVSTQMNIMNGQVKQSIQHTYFLEPLEVGEYYLAPASVKVNGEYLETPPLPLNVYPNPDGIIQPFAPSAPGNNPFGSDFFGSDLLNQDDFFNSDVWGDDFFQQFFRNTPFGETLPPLDSLREASPKKRKTTRI